MATTESKVGVRTLRINTICLTEEAHLHVGSIELEELHAELIKSSPLAMLFELPPPPELVLLATPAVQEDLLHWGWTLVRAHVDFSTEPAPTIVYVEGLA